MVLEFPWPDVEVRDGSRKVFCSCFSPVYVCVFQVPPYAGQDCYTSILLIDVIHSVRIFAVDAGTILQMETFGHLGLGTECNVGINIRKFRFD